MSKLSTSFSFELSAPMEQMGTHLKHRLPKRVPS